MGVSKSNIRYLGGQGNISGSFIDSLDNTTGSITGPLNNSSVNNFNWVMVVLGLDAPFASPIAFMNTFSFGSTLSGGGGTGLATSYQIFAANPGYVIPSGIIPVRLMPALGTFNSPFYAAKKKFIQFTFNSITAAAAGGVCLINFEDVSGTGVAGNQNICHDAYLLRCDGNLIRHNSGTANSVLANGYTFTQGDVWRMAMDASSASQTVLTVSQNGAVQTTFTDNNANRLTGPAMPCIAGVTGPQAGWSFQLKNFSCGLGL